MDKRVFEFYVAGVKHHRAGEVIDEMAENQSLELHKDSTNPYDPNAVKLLYYSNMQDSFVPIGFVPKKHSEAITNFMSIADFPTATITRLEPAAQPWEMIKVRVYDLEG